ncbi:hypothetical protein RF55_26508 [Lasius niger]|uniref:Uncharacterized protein n=1 Tax=Lasius niger TaxID=67767 RepID=A0A0J7JU25_LASNI|nr:hypothetical protein RF55_26508 [Lasius niger]
MKAKELRNAYWAAQQITEIGQGQQQRRQQQRAAHRPGRHQQAAHKSPGNADPYRIELGYRGDIGRAEAAVEIERAADHIYQLVR